MKPFAIALSVVILGGAVAMAESRGGGGGGRKGPPPQQGGHQGGSGGGQNGEHRGPTSRPSPDQIFDRFDADHNGAWSREEFKEFFSHRPPPPPRDGNAPGEGDRPPPPPRD